MNKLRYIFFRCCSFGLMLLLSGCNLVILQPKGMIAADEKQLLIDAVLLMLIVVIPVIILTVVFAIKYRASNTKAKYRPNWSHSTILEAGWWAIPIVIIIVLATMTWRSSHQLDPYRPIASKDKPITVQVVALQWRWLFIYPEQKIATINFVELPVNTPVNFLITADAPMNSFQIPALGGQIYAMPGMQSQLHLISDVPGNYNGRSVNLSGDGFANMSFIAKVASQQDFTAWVKTVSHSSNELNMNTYNQLAAPSQNTNVEYFTLASNDLFKMIIMKFMQPGMGSMQSGPATIHDTQAIHNTTIESHKYH